MSSFALPRASDTASARPALSGAAGPARREPDWRLVLLGVLVVSAAYVLWHLGRNWLPWDDGALAQSAERVSQGQLPHRDFDDVYTGGLAWLNAAAFRVLGTTLWTLRVVLFAVFLVWVPAVFYIASRFARPLAAGGVTLLAVAWSLPNYPAAMPSWYNLFLASFGVAALCRYLEDGKGRWLVAAGIAGGLSFIVKVIGLYYVAGVLLFLVFHAHALSRSVAGADRKRGTAYAAFVSVALLLFMAALWSVVRHQPRASEIVQYVVPSLFVATLLARNEWTLPAGESRARFTTLARLIGPFLIGVAVPPLLFLVPYARSGALGAFAHGVFVLPMRRFYAAFMPAPAVKTMFVLVPFVLLAVVAHRAGARVGRRLTTALAAVVAVALVVVLIVTRSNGVWYRDVWYAMRNLLPVLVVCGVTLLSRDPDANLASPLRASRMSLLLCVTALCSVVQFPFSASIYFSYVAPLVALSALAVYSYARPAWGAVPGLLVAFFAAFAVLRVNSSPLGSMGIFYEVHYPMAPLTLERGGIEVPSAHVGDYETLIALLRQRARGGYTWASPDAPEIYFLSGLRNPTRSLYEIFDDLANRDERVLRALDDHGVTAIVLNGNPSFSPGITPQMFSKLATRYPYWQNIGFFHLRWRK